MKNFKKIININQHKFILIMNRKVNLSGMRTVSLDSIFEEKETCNECETETVINTCNKCGNGV